MKDIEKVRKMEEGTRIEGWRQETNVCTKRNERVISQQALAVFPGFKSTELNRQIAVGDANDRQMRFYIVRHLLFLLNVYELHKYVCR